MTSVKEVVVPDIGDFKDVDVIEVLVSPGDQIKVEDPLITLETDKATMDVPSPYAGVVKEVKIKVGDKVSQGVAVALLEADESVSEAESAAQPQAAANEPEASAVAEGPAAEAPVPRAAAPTPPAPAAAPSTAARLTPPPTLPPPVERSGAARAHASPSVRAFARELGVDLTQVQGTGPKGRILQQDVQAFVKQRLSHPGAAAPAAGYVLPAMPEIDFSKFGTIELQPLSRIKKIAGPHLHRSWVLLPHVTQHDEADITELEAFRQEVKEDAKSRGVRLTLLAFLLKASVAALKAYPQVNASLDPGGENLILKKYYHIGVAVDTPDGLVVPVIRDVDKKGVYDLAEELGEVSARARDKALTPTDLQGGCFTISSLGGIGGTAFTPIINAPEVAILGVSRSRIQPVYRNGEFMPRLILPLSLSYDHRVIDGAQAARFTGFLGRVLTDVRRLLL
ncbi:MAG: dihydrolipoyllysine-residue acetyltransferase [Acidiferrobacterales bacterium]|nr:dihydrolipoyllysine-residue acetyltransferase [Gammaproteobacteria bacterium]